MQSIFSLDELGSLPLKIHKGNKIFLYWDLGAGKTTLSGYLISKYLWEKKEVKSPTYTYYQRYGEDVYHFDLYRLRDYDAFFAIGGEEILDDLDTVCLVEWPEIIKPYIKPDIEIYLGTTPDPLTRTIKIIYHS